MVKVKKRDGRLEDFTESKIVEGIKKAGASAEEAAQVAKKITKRMEENTEAALQISEVTSEVLSRMVIDELKKINKTVADGFVKFRDDKLRGKRK